MATGFDYFAAFSRGARYEARVRHAKAKRFKGSKAAKRAARRAA